jgi:DNA mismatch repair protein MutS2
VLDARGQPRPRPLPPAPPPQGKPTLSEAIRLDANTCDLRGQRVDDAIDLVESFVDRAVLRGDRYAFVLHGHGTGALKQAIRSWARTAPAIRSSRPAAEDQGGDAFTVLELR